MGQPDSRRSAAARSAPERTQASRRIRNLGRPHNAEANGKRSFPDRIRYLEIARGSALECAACLDVLVARSRLVPDVASQGKATLVRIVSTITKLIERHLRDADASTSTSTRRNGPSR